MVQDCKYAPIVLFTYNRKDYTERILSSINSARGANESELFIYSDAPASDEYFASVIEVRKSVHNFIKEKSLFRKVIVIEAEKNKGLAKSIIDGVTDIICKYGRAIVLEDDLIVSTDFIEYMNAGLEYYCNDSKIWALSGYTFPMKVLNNYQCDVYLAMRGSSWGWATWADRWTSVDWEVEDYKTIKYDLKKRLDFGRWGRDMPFMLDANVYGLNNSWAIRWCYAAYKQQKYTVYPKISRVVNAGTDGSGTNFKKVTHIYDTNLSDGLSEVSFIGVKPDKNIEREFRWKTKKKLGFIRDHFKWMIIKMCSPK